MDEFNALKREIGEIANLINPMARIDYAHELRATEDCCEALGYDYDSIIDLNGFCMPDRRSDYILVSIAHGKNPPRAAKHELFHSIQGLLLPDEISILREHFDAPDKDHKNEPFFWDACADAFSQWSCTTCWRGPALVGLLFYRIFTGEVAARSAYHRHQVWTAEASLVVDSATITDDHIILNKDGREKRIDHISLRKILRNPLPPFRFRSPAEDERVREMRARGGAVMPIFGCGVKQYLQPHLPPYGR